MKDLSQFSKIYLVPLADLHQGSRDADYEISDGYIRWIQEHENAFTIINGDALNCSWKDSTPELYEDLITPDDAYKALLARLMPIKDKVLMVTRGGHEYSIFHKVGVDFSARLAYDLGDIPYKPDGGMVGIQLSLNNHKLIFTCYATHGWSSGRTIGAKARMPEELALGIEADCYIVSHTHTQAIHRLNVLAPPHSRFSCKHPVYMQIRRKLLINTGGFVRYNGYAQRKGLIPQDLGTPRILMEIKKSKGNYYKDIHASM